MEAKQEETSASPPKPKPAFNGELNLVDKGLTMLPPEASKAYATRTTSVNLSENRLRDCSELSNFVKLDTLVLDHNSLTDLACVPSIPSLTTLWFNNNSVVDLKQFLDQAVAKFPAMTYLSFMRNPASPSMVCISEEDAAALRRYRLYVIYRIPRLVFLDSSPVSQKERAEALKRGQFLTPRRPATSSAAYDEVGIERAEDVAKRPVAAAPSSPSRRMSAFIGLGASHYDGSHSEGNRFIGNDSL